MTRTQLVDALWFKGVGTDDAKFLVELALKTEGEEARKEVRKILGPGEWDFDNFLAEWQLAQQEAESKKAAEAKTETKKAARRQQ